MNTTILLTDDAGKRRRLSVVSPFEAVIVASPLDDYLTGEPTPLTTNGGSVQAAFQDWKHINSPSSLKKLRMKVLRPRTDDLLSAATVFFPFYPEANTWDHFVGAYFKRKSFGLSGVPLTKASFRHACNGNSLIRTTTLSERLLLSEGDTWFYNEAAFRSGVIKDRKIEFWFTDEESGFFIIIYSSTHRSILHHWFVTEKNIFGQTVSGRFLYADFVGNSPADNEFLGPRIFSAVKARMDSAPSLK